MLRKENMAQPGVFWLSITICMLSLAQGSGYDSFADSLLREVMNHMSRSDGRELGNDFDISSMDDYSLSPLMNQPPVEDEEVRKPEFAKPRVAKEYNKHLYARHDDILGREPSIRDQEYLEHSSLFGHQYVQGGAGEGNQRLRPDGSMKNIAIVKTDGVLPAYCNPPNPCPLGYTREDGCLDEFENTAEFSNAYQSAQECMCDAEHMFDCPSSTRENEMDALARSIQNEGIMDSTLNQIVEHMQIDGEHKNLAAKKFFSSKPLNPYLRGEQLPVVAKKSPRN